MVDLRPAMSLVTEVSHTATVAAGEGVSATDSATTSPRRPTRRCCRSDTRMGSPRDLGLCGGEVLIGAGPGPYVAW
ncbi:MAG: hypothetical protein R2789_16930 [Microthrixaceae bacterium]